MHKKITKITKMKTYQQNENQYYTGCRAKLTRDGDNRENRWGLFRTWKIFRDSMSL